MAAGTDSVWWQRLDIMAGEFVIHVKTMGGATMTFTDVKHDTTIADVKDKIHGNYPVGGMPTHEQRLMFAGTLLDDDGHTLSFCKITAGAVIVMTEWPYDGYNIGELCSTTYHNIDVNIAWAQGACAILDFGGGFPPMTLTGLMGTLQVPGATPGLCISSIYAPGPDPRSCSTHGAPYHLRILHI
jgi:hypothetical protein